MLENLTKEMEFFSVFECFKMHANKVMNQFQCIS